ncbi:MAG: chorismate-binding protein, partial [Planctomycetes bacterium]|nr:chorismate-binding protein [Planctomycetota bacterium]
MMIEYIEQIRAGKAGQIIPVVRDIGIGCPVEYFAKLSDYGRKQDSCLFESREHLEKDAGTLTFGTADPALYLTGTGAEFTIKALSATGKRMLRFLAGDKGRFSFCEAVNFADDEISGTLRQSDEMVDEEARLKTVNQMDVLRAVAFAFELASQPFRVTCGLLGALSYDFIDQFERLDANESDILGNPDYEVYFADNIFLMDHQTGQGHVVVNVMITDDDRESIIADAEACFASYYAALERPVPQPRSFEGQLGPAGTDTGQAEYEKMVQTAKGHIIDGDIFQVVLSRTITEPCKDEPLDVYRRLRELNPSPYMFYLNTQNTILTGASPELNLKVSGTEGRVVEIRPIAGTKPRGRVNGKIDPDSDARYEAELKLDRKELAEHMMLVDLARNDIARVAKPGSRVVTELLTVEKYASVQHLVSNVKGRLGAELDALSAYLATM